jgi:hypothetical protein
MAPDFGYYVGQFDFAREAHSPLGVLVLCLPAGLLVVVLLRWLRGPIIELLPQPHRAALMSLPPAHLLPGLAEWLPLCLAVVVGAATHAAWDSFTHATGLAVRQLPFLQLLLFQIGDRKFHLFNSLQHASTVLGALCLAVAYVRWLRRTAPAPRFRDDGHDRVRRKVLLTCLAAAMLLALPMALAKIGRAPGPISISRLGISAVIYATTFAALLIALAALWWARRRAEER